MDSQIPEHFSQVTKCFTSDVLEDGTSVTALCTTSSQLLELVDKKVTDSCDIDREADDITTFTSYDPLQKYYLLHCQKHLVVVKRSKPLCVIKTYDDVVDIKIQDKLQIGRPQVVIQREIDSEPIITDFVGQLQSATPHVVPVLTASLSGKLQEMNARVAKARKLLQEKRNARFKALCRFTPHLHLHDGEPECEPKVLAWGPPLPSPKPVAEPPLMQSRPWRKIHNGRWIIGVPVYNTTTSPIHGVKLRLQLSSAGEVEPLLKYQSVMVGFVQRSSGGAEWMEPRCCTGPLVQTQVEIAGRSTAVLVGVLEEPLFKKSSTVLISGTVLYRLDSQCNGADVQDTLDAELQFSVEDLIQGNLVPFFQRNTHDESDLISVIVSSRSWQLSASSRYRMSAPLSETLAEAGLIQVKELGCWVGPHPSEGALRGLLVIESGITSTGHSLHVYARDLKQALQFVHSVNRKWKLEVYKGNIVTVQDCITNLRTELCTLHSVASPNAEYTPDEWDQIRNKLNTLELTTDLSFMSPHLST